MKSTNGKSTQVQRQVLPIPDQPYAGFLAYDAKIFEAAATDVEHQPIVAAAGRERFARLRNDKPTLAHRLTTESALDDPPECPDVNCARCEARRISELLEEMSYVDALRLYVQSLLVRSRIRCAR
jgi:hypothetical protein